jgi:sec-independent protein translocase protein TatB
MFDVGFSELLIIAVVALLVLGPERLPHAARMAGAFFRRARIQWEAVKAELERELETDRLKADLDAAARGVQAPIRELEQALRESLPPKIDLVPPPTPAAPHAPPPAQDAEPPR